MVGLTAALLLMAAAVYLGLFYKNGPAWYVFSSSGARAVSSSETNNSGLGVLASTIFASDPGADDFRFISWAQEKQDRADHFYARVAAVLVALLGAFVAFISIKVGVFQSAISLFKTNVRTTAVSGIAICAVGIAFVAFLLVQRSLPAAVSMCVGTQNVSLADLEGSCAQILRYGDAPKDLQNLARAKLAWVHGLR